MKKRFSKILLATLVIALVFGVCLGLTAAAEDSTYADIAGGKNANGVWDFEGATEGAVPVVSNGYTIRTSTSTSTEVTITTSDDGAGKVLQYDKHTKGSTGASTRVMIGQSSQAVNTAIVTAKAKMVSMTSQNRMRIYIASYGNDVAMLEAVYLRLDGNQVQFEGSGGWVNIGAAKNEWFEIKFVYYEGDDSSFTNRKLSVYFNDTLFREYTDASVFKRNYTAESVGVFGVLGLSSAASVMQFDDIAVEHKQIATPEIMAANVSHNSNLYLYYAVPKSSITTGEMPKLIGEDANGSFVITSYTEETVQGVECYIFKTRGVPAKELNTTETVRVVAGDTMSEPLTYSVEKYLYDKLYNDGFVLETKDGVDIVGKNDGKDYARKMMYFNLLEYGAFAQQVLADGEFDPIADVPYVSINGTAEEYRGESAIGTEFTLSAPASGNTVVSYKVVSCDAFGQNIVISDAAVGDTITINGFTLVYPVYAS